MAVKTMGSAPNCQELFNRDPLAAFNKNPWMRLLFLMLCSAGDLSIELSDAQWRSQQFIYALNGKQVYYSTRGSPCVLVANSRL